MCVFVYQISKVNKLVHVLVSGSVLVENVRQETRGRNIVLLKASQASVNSSGSTVRTCARVCFLKFGCVSRRPQGRALGSRQ